MKKHAAMVSFYCLVSAWNWLVKVRKKIVFYAVII